MDVQLDLKNNRLLKWLVVILVLLIAFMLIKYAQVRSENKSLEKAYEKRLQDEISEKESLIKDHKAQIEVSKNTIFVLEKQQDQYKHSLDSLSALKQRVKTVYKDRIIELESFSSLEIENYWKHKFSIDE